MALHTLLYTKDYKGKLGENQHLVENLGIKIIKGVLYHTVSPLFYRFYKTAYADRGTVMNADNKGYIKLWRNIQDWEWIDDPITTYTWIMILLNVNWQDKTWKGMIIPKGSMFTSIDQLSKLCRQTNRQTRTALNHLISTNHLTSKPTNKGTLITVVNWEFWQENSNEATSEMTSEVTSQVTNEATSKVTTTKEDKEYKELKKHRNLPPPMVDGGTMTRKDINGLLDPDFVDSINDKYGTKGGMLLDDCISDIVSKHRQVTDLERYIIGYIDNHKDEPIHDDILGTIFS